MRTATNENSGVKERTPVVHVDVHTMSIYLGCVPGMVDLGALPLFLAQELMELNVDISWEVFTAALAKVHKLHDHGTLDWQEIRIGHARPLPLSRRAMTVERTITPSRGTIRCDHDMVVLGNIEPGSTVVTGGFLKVFGSVDAANVETGGALTITGSLTGTPGATIRSGGDVRARRIVDAEVIASGDITVSEGIENSSIVTRGAARLPKAHALNSHIEALNGIEAWELGAGTTLAMMRDALEHTPGHHVTIHGRAQAGTRICFGPDRLLLDLDTPGPFHAALTRNGITMRGIVGPRSTGLGSANN